MNAPPPTHEQQRLARLYAYGILDTEPEDAYDDLARLAAYICGTPIAAVTLVDAHRQFFKSVLGAGVREVPREASFCAHTILQPDVLVIHDTCWDGRFAGNPFVTGDPNIRFYAGAPLVTEDGHALGSLCVLDRVPRVLTPDQEAALRVLARQVVAQMEGARRVEELRRSEAKLRGIIDASPVPFCLNDERQNITLLNAQFVQTFGYTLADIPTLADWWPRAYPDPEYRRRVMTAWRSRVEAAGRGAAFEPMELKVRCKDGTTRAVVADAAALEPGFRGQHLVILHDVTERRRQEDDLRQLGGAVASATEGITIADARDPALPLTYVNPVFLALTGYAESEVLGRSCRFLQGAGTDPDARRRLRQALDAGRDCRVTLQNYRKDGSEFWNELTIAPIRDAAGGLTHYVGIQHDVTALKETEAALRRGEARLIEAQRMAKVGSWEYDVATGASFWSPEMFRLLDLDPAEGELDYDGNLALYQPEDAAHLDALVRQAVAEGTGYELDIRRPSAHGAAQWYHVIGTVVRDAAGRVARLAGTMQDITERRRAEEFVRRSEARLVEAQRISGTGDWEMDMAARRLAWSDEVFRLMEFDPADGEPDYDAVRGRYHPDDLPERDRLFARALETGEPYQCDLRLDLPSGTPRWCHLVGRPVRDSRGRVVRVAGTVQDITERVLSEQEKSRLADYNRLLLESTAEGIYGVDLAGRCTFINGAGARLLGYAAPEVVGRDMHALIHHSRSDGSPYPMEDCPICRAFQRGGACHVEAEVLWRRDGAAFSAEYSSFPLREPGGVIGAVVTFSDITERAQAEQRVRDASTVLAVQKVQLEAANAELEALATTDPLTGLLNHRAFQQRLAEATAQAARDGTAHAVALLDLDGFHYFNDVYGTAAGDSVLRRVAARLRAACGAGDAAARFSGDEFTLLLPTDADTTHAAVEARLRAALAGLSYQPAGDAADIPITLSLGVALFPQDGPDRQDVVQQAEERLRRAKTGGAGEADAVRAALSGSVQGFSMLDALVTAVDNKDRYTRRHSEDVMTYSLQIAQELGMDEAQRRTVAVAALLHDVGKIGVPDHVLRKPGGLTAQEFEAVRQHPQMGAIIVAAVPGLEGTLDAVRHHHERWDGGGYPFGLRGGETPLLARLMAVADAFSAMTMDRPYRRGMGRGEARALLAAGAGSQWDPDCVRAFLRAQVTDPAPGVS